MKIKEDAIVVSLNTYCTSPIWTHTLRTLLITLILKTANCPTLVTILIRNLLEQRYVFNTLPVFYP
ncbi:hypothetical protein [Spirosoma jeollabukense]